MDRSSHIKGLLITFTAVVILSPDALLVRLIHCDVWTLLFWRCLLTGSMQALFLAVIYRRQFLQSFRNIGRIGLFSAGIVTTGSFFFVNALRHTAAANALIILAATPLFSSLLSWLFLRDKIARRTWLAITICFGGILLIFSGSLRSGLLFGDLLALGATLMWASNLVVLRKGKAVNMVPANLLGNLMVVPITLLAGAQPLSVSPIPDRSRRDCSARLFYPDHRGAALSAGTRSQPYFTNRDNPGSDLGLAGAQRGATSNNPGCRGIDHLHPGIAYFYVAMGNTPARGC
jgi:drug/metabolite transporter (DMT)-like permease